jgi:glycosyltransferase involved in cell wall biosynthesis
MKISVVIPAFNEEKLIVDSLRAIKQAMTAFSERGWATELIVCNNNSTDRTAALAENEGAKVVFEPINQISRARNCGAAAATGDWLVFVDADSYPSRELFADAAEKMETGAFLAGGVIVKMDEAPLAAHLFCSIWNLVSRTTRWVAGSFIFCNTDAFRKVGGFSTELFASEEIDLSKKLKAHAKRVGKRMVILKAHPLITSGRKLKLYSRGDHFRILFRALTRPSATLKNRDECKLWYDGRR